MLQNIACIDNRLYRQHFTIQFIICHHVYRHYENSTHIYHIYNLILPLIESYLKFYTSVSTLLVSRYTTLPYTIILINP